MNDADAIQVLINVTHAAQKGGLFTLADVPVIIEAVKLAEALKANLAPPAPPAPPSDAL